LDLFESFWVVDVWNCCWFNVLPNRSVQLVSKLVVSFLPRRSLLILLVSNDNDERRSEKSLSCSTDEVNKSARLSLLSDVVLFLAAAAAVVAWSIVVNFSNSRSWSSSWESVISINALIGSVRSIFSSKNLFKNK